MEIVPFTIASKTKTKNILEETRSSKKRRTSGMTTLILEKEEIKYTRNGKISHTHGLV